uniref:Uncharacterized protein n=1 Tax=Chenopodium quinoa TaxID=63459 RepID=A0A803MPD2_CHEQI
MFDCLRAEVMDDDNSAFKSCTSDCIGVGDDDEMSIVAPSSHVYLTVLLDTFKPCASDCIGIGGEEDKFHLLEPNTIIANFPSDFIFGASSSAYQVEGAAFEDGRTPSIYDTFSHSGRITGGGEVACDEYHRYKEDVQLMVNTGLDAYRFSISWSRLIPRIQPHVTLIHSDLPQVLEDEYEGFLSPRIIEDFTAYVDVCFREFGDRVQHWTTFYEANIFPLGGYDAGITPPARCSYPFGLVNCTIGNSTTEPYVVAHQILLAHASAARIYKEKYQALCVGD